MLNALFIRSSLIISLVTSVIVAVNAQFDVVHEQRNMSMGMQPAYIVSIQGADDGKVQNNWTRTLRRDLKARVRSSRDEIAATRVVFVALGLGDIEIYSRVSKLQSGVQIIVWFRSSGTFVSEATDLTAHNEIIRFMQRFAHDQVIEQHQDAVSEQERKMADQERNLTRLQREKQRLEGNITRWEQQITEARQRIYQNEKEQEELNRQIKSQAEHLDDLRRQLEEVKRKY